MQKRASMKDIAAVAGVSKTAVSLALRNSPQVSRELCKRIQTIARELGYVRNPKVGELMSQMRSARYNSQHGILALFNCNQNRNAFLEHPTIPSYVTGCRRRAQGLGYAIDVFWLYEPDVTAKRWISILKARNICGIVMVGLMRQNRVPEQFKPVVEQFATTVTGVRTRRPPLSYSCADHHMLTLQAFEKAIALGYQRPGLVMEQDIDNLVDHRFSSAFRTGQQKYFDTENHTRPFMSYDKARTDRKLFDAWFNREQPDVILTLYNTVERWLNERDIIAPRDVGLIQLEWRSQHPHWAGMDQHNDVCGEAAVDMTINQVHNGEIGFPDFPRATLIGASWIDGTTVRAV